MGHRSLASSAPGGQSAYRLRISGGTMKLAPDRIVSMLTSNGQFAGPLVRLKYQHC
jgi:hypothetical protein